VYSMFCYVTLLHPVSQISARGSVLFGYPGLGCTIFEQCFYLSLMGVELALANAFRASQRHPLLLACGKRFRRPLGYQIPLNFRSHSKGHRDNLTLDTIIELPVPFDSVDADTLLHGQGKDFHALQHAPAQAGQLADDDGITFLSIFQNGGDLEFPRFWRVGKEKMCFLPPELFQQRSITLLRSLSASGRGAPDHTSADTA
jgi:hypothetical protein